MQAGAEPSRSGIPGLTPARPDLPRLEEIVALCERRARRAAAKLRLAELEQAAATTALEQARAARAHWIANNDDPQLMML